MDQAADMLRRICTELGITIIWVEHIMGVLMRVVDRVMVLDHGEKIAEGLPAQVAGDPARDRGLSRHPARRPRRVAAAPRLTRPCSSSTSVRAGYGTFQALFDVSLEVRAGEAVARHRPQRRGQDHADARRSPA